LRDLFPGEDCLFSAEQTLVYGVDAGRVFYPPWAVVRPDRPDQVVELLRWADAERIPIFPRARATNVVGACVPKGGGVVVSTLKMNRVLDIDPGNFTAVVEPGVVTGEFQRQVAEMGLFYPPDPASVRICTIGGNVSTNAGGMRAVKYGVTGDWVLGIRAVLPGGHVVNTGGHSHKNVAGLDLTGLLVGSEGTLAFMTRIVLKLIPAPAATGTLMLGFSTLDAALNAAGAMLGAGILPTAMELMAEEVLECLAGLGPVPWPGQTRAVLLVKLDGSRAALAEDLAGLRSLAAGFRPCFVEQGIGPDQEEPMWEMRRLINQASFRLAPDKLSQDIAVPRALVGRAVREIRAVGEKHGLPVLTFGHLGDGNIHVNVMYDADNSEQAGKARQAIEDVLVLVLEMGGTITGEHGIGLAKLKYLDMQVPGIERDLMRRIKAAFDPNSVMNPGKAY